MNHNETGQQPYTKVSLVFKFLYGSKRYFLISIAAALCVTGVDMLSPQLIRTTVDGILGENALQLPGFLVDLVERIGGVGYLRERLWLIGGLLVLLALLSVTFRYLFILFNAKGAESLAETMRNCLFSHIQRLPFAWHMQNQTGDIIQRCTSDVDMVKNFISEQLTSVFRIVILIILSLLFMFSMNAKLTLVALASIPIIIAYSTYFHSKISSQFMKCDENEGILSTIAQENLTGVRVVRAFGREKYEKDRFEKQNNIYTNLWIRLCRLLALFWGAGDLISGLQVMLIVIFGSVFCVRGSMTAGEFIAFISYNAMLTWPVRSLGRMIAEMSKAGVSIERIRYIMNSPVEQDKPDAVTPDMNGDIAFENVTFAYADTPILSDISFRIPQGTTFGILGGTGSGKSTLMHLLNRLYDHHWRCGYYGHEGKLGAFPYRHGAAGTFPVLPHDCGEYRHYAPEYGVVRYPLGGIHRLRGRCHHGIYERLRYRCGRAGRHAVRRAETADGHGAHVDPADADHDLRRFPVGG